MPLLLVALGGALGTAARYLLGLALAKPSEAFPYATLAINVTGCLAIGLLVPILKAWNIREPWQLMILVGVLGGYTTFSTFGRETLALVDAHRWGAAVAYVLLSNGLGIAAVALGALLAQRFTRIA
jgi:CrcB protein